MFSVSKLHLNICSPPVFPIMVKKEPEALNPQRENMSFSLIHLYFFEADCIASVQERVITLVSVIKTFNCDGTMELELSVWYFLKCHPSTSCINSME